MARSLTAILALDTVGYSRLMAADEEGTHARLKAHREELLDPTIAKYQGHVIKNTGDGLLAEFPSSKRSERRPETQITAPVESRRRCHRHCRVGGRAGLAIVPSADCRDGGGRGYGVSAAGQAIHCRSAI